MMKRLLGGILALLAMTAGAEGWKAELTKGRYFQVGDAVSIVLSGDELGQGGMLEIRDWRGDPVARFTVGGGERKEVNFKADRCGVFFLAAWPGEVFDSFAVTPPPERRQSPDTSPYGVFLAYVDDFQSDLFGYGLALMKRAGVPWVRATTFVTPAGNGFDWSKRDRLVEMITGNDMRLLSFFEEMGFPAEWKTNPVPTGPASTAIGAINTEANLPVLWNDRRVEDAVVDYARHYQGKLRCIEVWNECNARNGAPAYFAYHKRIHDAVKAAVPDALIAETGFASTAYPGQWGDTALGQDLQKQLIGLGIDDCCDIYNFHYYPYQWRTEAIVPEYVEPIRAVSEKEIWVTENGMGATWPDHIFQMERQAEYLVKSMSTALALGCDRYFWFLLNDHPAFNMGILTGANCPKPIYAAYAAATWLLDDADWRQASFETGADGLRRIEVPLRGRGSAQVVWSERAPFEVPVPAGALVYDLMGNRLNPKQTLPVGECPVYFITEKAE